MTNERKTRGIRILFCMLLFLGIFMQHSFVNAEDVDIYIALSADTVTAGDTVTVTVSVNSEKLASMDLSISYSSDILEYVGGDAGGGGGSLSVSATGTGTIPLTFKAIANGSARVSTGGTGAYDADGNNLTVSHAGVTVTVTGGGAATEEKTDATTDPSEASTEATEATTEKKESSGTGEKSDDCSLASLVIDEGTLTPEFSPEQTSYQIKVEKDVQKLTVTAEPSDPKAGVEVSGADKMTPGFHVVRVVVTAENRAVKIYTVSVQCGDEAGAGKVTIDGVSYSIIQPSEGEVIPDGYQLTTTKYKNMEVPAYVSSNQVITILALEDSDHRIKWFMLDGVKDELTPYVEYTSAGNRYVILNKPSNVEVPEGFEQGKASLGSGEVTVYKSPDLGDIFLVYATNPAGTEGLYYYDSVEKTFLRYIGSKQGKTDEEKKDKGQDKTGEESTKTKTKSEDDSGFFSRSTLIKMLIGAVALFVIMSIASIVLMLKNQKLQNLMDEDYPEPEDYNENETGDEGENKPMSRRAERKARRDAEKAYAREMAAKAAEEKDAEQSAEEAAGTSEVTGETIEIILEEAMDNNKDVHVPPAEDPKIPTVEDAMKTRPYGIDSAFDVVDQDPGELQESQEPQEPVDR